MTDTLPLGLHFGLPEQDHHDDAGLGSSSIKALLTSPVNGYWKRSPHGKRIMEALGLAEPEAEEPSLSQQFGSAAHVAVLEPHRFDDAYIEAEDAPPEYLTSRDVIREGLELAGGYLPPRSASREEYVMAAKRAGLKVVEDWKADFAIKAGARKVLSRRWRAQLRMIEHLMDVKRADLGGDSLRGQNFSNGYPEVTIIWEENGVRMKARIDYLRTGGMIDLKTYAAPDDASPVEFFMGQIRKWAYDLQAAHYGYAWAQIGPLIDAGAVYGDVDPDWIARLRKGWAALDRAGKPVPWRWVAVQSMGFPEVDFVDFTAGLAMGAAQVQRDQAIETYRRFMDEFGPDQPWISRRGRIVVDDVSLEAAGLHRSMLGRGEQRWTSPE
jgi:hypothetical protein